MVFFFPKISETQKKTPHIFWMCVHVFAQNFRKHEKKIERKLVLNQPIGSMGLVYLPTFGGFLWFSCIGKYAVRPMDPMGSDPSCNYFFGGP